MCRQGRLGKTRHKAKRASSSQTEAPETENEEGESMGSELDCRHDEEGCMGQHSTSQLWAYVGLLVKGIIHGCDLRSSR